MLGRQLALFFAVLGFQALAWSPAWANSPKDAIKTLPQFTHTSRFLVTQNDFPGGRTYDDNYFGDWTVDWRPPSVPLGSRARLKYAVYYATTLQDLINRVEGQSSDLRRDYFRVNLNLDDVSWLQAGYALEHSDTFKARREWGAEHASSGNLAWAAPGLPRVAYGFINRSSTRNSIDGQSTASEFEMAQYRVEFARDAGAFGQHFTYINEDKRSVNYLPPGGTDEHISRFEGDRQFPLGPLGNLNLAYYYDQYSRSDVGSPDASTTTTHQYRLSLNNRLPDLPLSYNYSYSDLQMEFPGGSHNNIATRSLRLEVSPPVPEGKSAAIGYFDELREADEPGKRIANTVQSVSWSIAPNKLTSANFSYSRETDYDRLAQSIMRKREGYEGLLNYNIPGERGSLSGQAAQWVESRPQGDARNSSDLFNLSSNLRLGPRASIIFTLAQQYSDSGSGLPGATFDTTRSTVHYRISWPNNLGLDATYQQQLLTRTANDKTVTETLGLKFDYRNDANWAYTFGLNLGDTRDITRITPDARQYETQNVIEARITYSF